jgi:hypothetical protein
MAGRQLDIKYSIDRPCRVSIALFHIDGRKMAEIVNEVETAGTYGVTWTGIGKTVSSMCIVAITAGDKKTERKVMLLGR